MHRRSFIRLSTGALAATSLGSWAGCTRVPDATPALRDPLTLGAFADDETVHAIGQAYLEAQSGRASRPHALVRALLEDHTGTLVGQDDPDALRAFLREKVAADFNHGRTLIADGWVLAVTEARQAALFTLTP
jgi:hypothetical protein